MWTIYLITRLDDIRLLFLFVIIGSIIVATVVLLNVDSEDITWEGKNITKSFLKTSIYLVAISCLVLSLLPSKKDVLFMYTGDSILNYTKNKETLQEIPDKVVKCFDKLMDEYLEENRKN